MSGGLTEFQTGLPECRDYLSPTKKEGFKLCLPIQEDLRFTITKWNIAKWVFLGMIDLHSSFFQIPVEIIFHVVSSTVRKL
jgi:hypothetical protein